MVPFYTKRLFDRFFCSCSLCVLKRASLFDLITIIEAKKVINMHNTNKTTGMTVWPISCVQYS